MKALASGNIHFCILVIALTFTPAGHSRASATDLFVCNGNGTIARVSPDGSVSTFVSGLGRPTDVAFDQAGIMYVSDFDRNTVSRVSPEGVVTLFASGLNRPQGIAFDAANNLYVANFAEQNVIRIASDGSRSIFASLLSGPNFLVFDSLGRLVVSTGVGLTIVAPDGTVTPVSAVRNSYYGLAFDAAGNLFGANAWNADLGSADGTVKRIVSDGTEVTFAGGMARPADLAFDEADNLYVSNLGDYSISRISPDGMLTTFATGLWQPAGIAFAPVPEPGPIILLVGGAMLALLCRSASRR